MTLIRETQEAPPRARTFPVAARPVIVFIIGPQGAALSGCWSALLGNTGVGHVFVAIAAHADVGLLTMPRETFQRTQARAVRTD